MSNIIFYTSATGNSLAVAQTIAKNIDDCEVVKITADKGADILRGKNYDYLGIVFPVWFCRPPDIVMDFACKVKNVLPSLPYGCSVGKMTNMPYIFSVCTLGLVGAGNALRLLQDKSGLKLDYARGVVMPENYIIGLPPFGDIEKTLKRADVKLAKISAELTKKCHRNTIFNPIIHAYSTFEKAHCAKLPEKFYVTEKCVKCGLCKKICPNSNINIGESVTFGTNCCQCCGCINLCPQSAIECGEKTKTRPRYRHPTAARELI